MRTFAWILGLFVLGFASIALFTYPAWLLLHPYFAFPFHRIGERIGLLTLIGAFALTARHLGLADRRSLGYGLPRSQFLREMLVGLGVGMLTMGGAVALMTALGLLDWTAAAGLTASALIKILLARLASGLAVGLIEETLLRGAMQTGIERESGGAVAVLLTAFLYSAVHFMVSFKIPAADVTPSSGVALLIGTLHLWAHPLAILDAFLCLFAVGVVLGSIRAATGNIAACIGLHAGWVWTMLTVHEVSQPQRAASAAFLLSRFDGFVGWLVLGWTVLVGLCLRRFYASGASTSSR